MAPPNRGGLKQHPYPWHFRAGRGAVHCIRSGCEQPQQQSRYSICSSRDQQQAQGHVNVERARRRQIDAQGEFGRKLDRQVANRRAPQDAIDVDARLPELFFEIR